jgi:hypothetical protein
MRQHTAAYVRVRWQTMRRRRASYIARCCFTGNREPKRKRKKKRTCAPAQTMRRRKASDIARRCFTGNPKPKKKKKKKKKSLRYRKTLHFN